jgi:hypothetical protein
MKKILLILVVLVNLNAKGQTIKENDLVRISNYQSPTSAKYRLYPTSNRFTFLRLNTSNGFIDVIQYSTADDDKTMIYGLSNSPIVDNGTIDRFTIYPTLNIWTFLLLDQVEGHTYQVQWSTDPKMRFVFQIRKEG